MSIILRRRDSDFGGVTQIVDLNISDPALISPTTAHTPAPPTQRKSLKEEADLARNNC